MNIPQASSRQKIWWTIKGLLGIATIKDGSLCWFSSVYHNRHDYPKHKGGDGTTFHGTAYKCTACGKEFYI